MSASQSGGPQVLDRPENSSSAEASAREPHVRIEDVDSPFQVILFADEEPEIVQARSLVLEALGFSVLIAGSAETLYLGDGAIEAVIVDYRMPGKDGEQTARKIREFGSNIPIILSSRCFSLPQRVLGLVDAPAGHSAVSQALQQMLEQQFQAWMHGDEILTN